MQASAPPGLFIEAHSRLMRAIAYATPLLFYSFPTGERAERAFIAARNTGGMAIETEVLLSIRDIGECLCAMLAAADATATLRCRAPMMARLC